jgi:hypothetical protein
MQPGDFSQHCFHTRTLPTQHSLAAIGDPRGLIRYSFIHWCITQLCMMSSIRAVACRCDVCVCDAKHASLASRWQPRERSNSSFIHSFTHSLIHYSFPLASPLLPLAFVSLGMKHGVVEHFFLKGLFISSLQRGGELRAEAAAARTA